ncbi:MAG TPA: hypothetical protein VNT75_23785 [Symbiobacteriaceae bacterium]|nr:hypothetical protein [Symbiobacteriaceae bacterium]
MGQDRMNHRRLAAKYPPSPPCACEVCVRFCRRPGWWTVHEATLALEAGYARRMMLELAPDLTFGVLSPAFRGCEGSVALNSHADLGCNFLKADRCELHGTGFQPLECRYCHHELRGLGRQCHLDIEKDWHTPTGEALVVRWGNLLGLGNFPSPRSIR